MKTKHATLTLEKFNSAPRESIQNFLGQLDRKATVTFVFLGSEEHRLLETETNAFGIDYSVRYGVLKEELEIMGKPVPRLSALLS